MERLFILGLISLAAVCADTIPDPEVKVDIKPAIDFNSSIGSVHEVTIAEYSLLETKSCALEASNGTKYDFKDLDIAGVDVLSQDDVACGLRIRVTSEDVVGDWTLVSHGTLYGTNIEKRQPFAIHVKELVDALVDKITVYEGNDVYFRLAKATEKYNSCQLIGPHDEVKDTSENTAFTEFCGYILKNAATADTGTWRIEYGDKIVYTAYIELNVTGAQTPQPVNLVWTKDRPVQAVIGPEDTIYCRIESSEGVVVFDKFGRCNISLDRAKTEHNGVWKMSVGLPGRVLTDDSQFTVDVVDADPKPVVNTSLVDVKPVITISCSVTSAQPVRACKFRQPSGRVLLATEGVGESRYNYHGTSVSYESGLHTHDCGIQITDPIKQDLGLWRCALESEDNTYYGFLTVFPAWVIQDPEDAATIVTEPVLTSNQETARAMVGDSLTMGCSVQEAIRYCYFRFRNGSVYNIGPEHSHDMATYVGAGFDAGECGIRFPTLAEPDSGPWTCNVGFPGAYKPEQHVEISVTIDEPIIAVQAMIDNQLHVEAQVYDHRELEYCRYVRIDGLGFSGSSNDVPDGYFIIQNLSTGRCGIVVDQPTKLDHHPWTVIARIKGQDVELSTITESSIDIYDRPTGTIVRMPFGWILFMALGLSILLVVMISPKKNREWTYTKANAVRSSFRNSFMKKSAVLGLPCAWIIILAIFLSVMILAIILGPKRNRQWTYTRASAVRNSFRNSFLKKAAGQENLDNKITAVAA